MSKLTVVIPNFNGKHFMDPCMSALRRQTYTDFDVLVVDNGSTDGSVEYLRGLRAADTRVSCLFLPENTGFSGAVNAGIAAAQGEYVVLLNNDTEPAPGYLAALCAVLDQDTARRIFAVSPKMIQLYHPDLLDDAGDGYNLLGWAFQRGVGQPVTAPRFNRTQEVFSACAGAAIYRKELLLSLAFPERGEARGDTSSKSQAGAQTRHDIGNKQVPDCLTGVPECFDLQHFAYLEDLDLSFRARIRGYRILYCPDAIVYHVGSGTSGSRYNAFKVRLAARNNVWLNYKNMPLLQLVVNLPGILLGTLIKQLFFLKIGFGKEYFNGFREGVHSISSCRKTRFEVRNLPHYLWIELRLITDTVSYARDFLTRHLCGQTKCAASGTEEGQRQRGEDSNEA